MNADQTSTETRLRALEQHDAAVRRAVRSMLALHASGKDATETRYWAGLRAAIPESDAAPWEHGLGVVEIERLYSHAAYPSAEKLREEIASLGRLLDAAQDELKRARKKVEHLQALVGEAADVFFTQTRWGKDTIDAEGDSACRSMYMRLNAAARGEVPRG